MSCLLHPHAAVAPVRKMAVRPVAAYKGDSVDTEEVNKKLQEVTTYLQVRVVLWWLCWVGPPSSCHQALIIYSMLLLCCFVQTKWEATEDKPAAVAVTAAAVLALITASSVVDAIVSSSSVAAQNDSDSLSAACGCQLVGCGFTYRTCLYVCNIIIKLDRLAMHPHMPPTPLCVCPAGQDPHHQRPD